MINDVTKNMMYGKSIFYNYKCKRTKIEYLGEVKNISHALIYLHLLMDLRSQSEHEHNAELRDSDLSDSIYVDANDYLEKDLIVSIGLIDKIPDEYRSEYVMLDEDPDNLYHVTLLENNDSEEYPELCTRSRSIRDSKSINNEEYAWRAIPIKTRNTVDWFPTTFDYSNSYDTDAVLNDNTHNAIFSPDHYLPDPSTEAAKTFDIEYTDTRNRTGELTKSAHRSSNTFRRQENGHSDIGTNVTITSNICDLIGHIGQTATSRYIRCPETTITKIYPEIDYSISLGYQHIGDSRRYQHI
jgi:hypothetical protein